MDCSPPGSSVHGISQARILGWVAISISKGSSWPRDRTPVSLTAGRQTLYRVSQNPPANTGDIRDMDSNPGSERYPGGEHRNRLQYSCLENPTDRGACGLQSMELERVGHDWSNLACMHTCITKSLCCNAEINATLQIKFYFNKVNFFKKSVGLNNTSSEDAYPLLDLPAVWSCVNQSPALCLQAWGALARSRWGWLGTKR